MTSFANMSRNLNAALFARGEEWAGLPMAIPGLSLTVERKNPWRARLLEMQAIVHETDDADVRGGYILADSAPAGFEMVTVRNQWFSTRLGQEVAILQDAQGRVTYAVSKHDFTRRFQAAFDTMRASLAWTLDTEVTAVEKLADFLPSHLWESYVLTGAFIQTSRRSGVTYLFRRLRPTLAFRDDRLLCALCLHPTGFYEDTHAGSLCPTDDVLAHLLLMRADEPFFWRRANQHAPWRPESGL